MFLYSKCVLRINLWAVAQVLIIYCSNFKVNTAISFFPFKNFSYLVFQLMHKNHRLLFADKAMLHFQSKWQRSMLCLSHSGKMCCIFFFFSAVKKRVWDHLFVYVSAENYYFVYRENNSWCSKRQDTELLVTSTCPGSMQSKTEYIYLFKVPENNFRNSKLCFLCFSPKIWQGQHIMALQIVF